MEKRNLTVAEFSDIYGPSKSRTYELINAGLIKKIKFGRSTYITVESAEAWRDSLLAEAAAGVGGRGVA